MSDILQTNAYLKFIEFILHQFDEKPGHTTLEEIRVEFQDKFGIAPSKLLNQHFGLIRLCPLIFIKEEYKKRKKPLEGNIKKIRIIRDAISHNDFSADEHGYVFKNDKEELHLTYEEFIKFIHIIENDFYAHERGGEGEKSFPPR